MQQCEYSLVDIQLLVNNGEKKLFSVDTFFCTLLKAQQQ